ncbi:MAG: hypothetical protein V2G44_06700 [bacterium JZ-2024 1]
MDGTQVKIIFCWRYLPIPLTTPRLYSHATRELLRVIQVVPGMTGGIGLFA